MSTNNSDNEPNSSPCLLTETDPAYHGYLTRDEVLALLNTLLSAERAGAKICTMTLRQADAAPLATLLHAIRKDEVASCQGLIRSIQQLGGKANADVGDFYEKCMTISDLNARLQLLNKGQQWVVRKLVDAVPNIMNDGVRAQLAEMLRVHEANIRLALHK